MSGYVYGATLAAALGCGLAAGVFFAFSAFVMPALDRLPPAQGVEAMQAINKDAVTPLFMTALFGTALACAALAVWAVTARDEQAARWILAAAALYLVGTIGVTIAANVPLNDSLAALDPHAAGTVSEWSSYVSDWTIWNHVRGLAALAAAGCMTVSLTVQ
jgi:uncharacterized membrane protein